MIKLTTDLRETVIAIAQDAAAAIMGVYATAFDVEIKSDRSPLTAADLAANQVIERGLGQLTPDLPILSEESAQVPWEVRQHWGAYWLVDPLDGTREFGEGRDDWAVHIALAVDGVPVVGAVALPAREIVLASDTPPALPAPVTPPRMLVSRTRPSQLCASVRDVIGAETIAMGSAGAKAMAVVLGEAEIYLHSGGQHQWDNCAPAAVALAAGLHASRINGSPLSYNARSTSVPDLLICRKEWAGLVLAAVGNCGG